MARNRSGNRQYPSTARKGKKKEVMIDTQPTTSHLVKVDPDVRKKFTHHDLKFIKPLTENQLYAYQEWAQGQHLVLEGYAGTGKSFLALHMALQVVLDPESEQDKVVIVRSATPTKDLGALPGELNEKIAEYETPYIQICDQLFKWKKSYQNLKEIGLLDFECTSYLRGTSWDNAVIIFDEFQCSTTAELDTVATRVGKNSRLIICGDSLHQNDIGNKSGGTDFLKILRKMESISFVEFGLDDIVRSGFVREFLVAKYGK